MLAKVYKLTTDSEYKLVKEKGRIYHSKNFTLSIYDRKEGIYPRFGFVVPNKVAPKAVDRNRIKRVLNEATRYQLSSLSPTLDCVFLPKPSILSAYAADVMREVGEAFVAAKMSKDTNV